MTIVGLTGCSGYIGTRLRRQMADDESVSRIVGVDLVPPDERTDKLAFYRMDVREPGLARLFVQEGVDVVVHLAFILDPLHDERLMHDVDIGGTENVLEATAACGARHLVIASSTTAFGAFPDNPKWLSEEHPIRRQPNFVYASDKYEMEQVTRAFADDHPDLGLAVVRPCIVYGPHVDNYLSRAILNFPAIPVARGARPRMQFVHEDDVAEVFQTVVRREATGTFHAIGAGTVGIDEVARMAGKPLWDIPPALLYPMMETLWRLHVPGVEGSSGMIDFLRYRWTASDDLTRQRLELGPRRSSREVVELMLEAKGMM